MAQKYTFEKYNKELMARVIGRDLGISTKQSIEICNRIRNKSVKRAKQILEDAISGERAIAYTRFNGGVGHKPGMAAGRYPIKTATNFLNLIKSAEANAQVKGLNTGNLCLVHVNAQKASSPMHQGRQRGTVMKRTHVEIVLQEKAEEKKEEKKKSEKSVKKEKVKEEPKKEVKETQSPEDKKPKVKEKPVVDKKESEKKE